MKKYIGMVLCFFGSTFSIAGEVTIPNIFTAGTPAKASEVNDNFSAVKTAVDDNNASILTNTREISSNDSDIAELKNKSWDLSGMNLFYSNGKVGIGTMNPRHAFHVHRDTGNSAITISTSDNGATGNPSLQFMQGLLDNDSLANFSYVGYDVSEDVVKLVHGGPTGAFDGSSRGLAVDGEGNVGVGTVSPMATLDINGYMKLSKNTSEPANCDATQDGSLALTSGYKMCACNGVNWIFTSDGTTSCSW